MDKISVDGIEFEREDVEALRETVIGWRDNSFKQWPQAIDFTVVASHLIAFLAGVLEQYPRAGMKEDGGKLPSS